jgi:hypothetical protein
MGLSPEDELTLLKATTVIEKGSLAKVIYDLQKENDELRKELVRERAFSSRMLDQATTANERLARLEAESGEALVRRFEELIIQRHEEPT